MFSGYLQFNGKEIINAARTQAYVKALLPGVQVRCDDTALGTALGHSAYVSPSRDKAPWFQGQRAASGRFYGLFPSRIEGAEDSTRKVEVTELVDSGAVITSPRHESREIRVKATAFAADEEAMMEGLAWLREVLAGDGCSDAEDGCLGRTAKLFSHRPATKVQASLASREFYTCEATDAPRVRRKHNSPVGELWDIEFTITAGTPWAFTPLADAATLVMDEGLNFQDPAGEDCAADRDAYDDYVDDPYFTGISRPPKPPTILPPNILDISSWRRKTAVIPANLTQRWGRTAPYIQVSTENAIQFLRLRFYRASAGLSGCDFDGEFLVSYIPATAVLTLDAVRRKASLRLSNGKVVPAAHLLFGSDGRPFLWPSLGCQHTYTMTADLMPGQPGAVVMLKTANRE